jgi:hypothetical protein
VREPRQISVCLQAQRVISGKGFACKLWHGISRCCQQLAAPMRVLESCSGRGHHACKTRSPSSCQASRLALRQHPLDVANVGASIEAEDLVIVLPL